MRSLGLTILILSALASTAWAQEVNVDELYSEDEADQETDGEASDIRSRLEKARQEEMETSVTLPTQTVESQNEAAPENAASGLTQAQKENLKNEPQEGEQIKKSTGTKRTAVTDKYNKPKHDWTFKKNTSKPETSVESPPAAEPAEKDSRQY